MIIPVILAGGSGTRLWPMSRMLYPKQLLPLAGANTMLQETLLRLRGMETIAAPFIICSSEHRYIVREQLREVDMADARLILEPEGKNTAPAVAVAAMAAVADDPEAFILVLPADHLIQDIPRFHQALYTAAQYAGQGFLITFGVIPDSPETGYGYIMKGRGLGSGNAAGDHAGEEFSGDAAGGDAHDAYTIEAFVEKPDLETARQYVQSGRYCWNSGMFMFKASQVYSELKSFAPDIVSACESAYQQGNMDGDALCLDAAAFARCPSDSIDYAIMEKTAKGAMVPFGAGWNDLGSWESYWAVGEKDDCGNVIKGEVLAHDIKDSLIIAGDRLVAAVGIENAVVVDTPDALLVASRDRSQDVKAIVSALKKKNRKEAVSHAVAYFPWGTMTDLGGDAAYALRRIAVRPDACYEIISPEGQTKHWTVVAGKGEIRIDSRSEALYPNGTVTISPRTRVEAKNPGDETIVIIEVAMSVTGNA